MSQTGVTSFEDLSPGPERVRRWLRFGLLGVLGADEAGGRRHLLVLRFGVLNTVALALLAAAWLHGWVGVVLANDVTGLVRVIALVFLAGLALGAYRTAQTSRELDEADAPRPAAAARVAAYCRDVAGRDGQSRAIAAAALRLRLAARIAAVRHLASSLVVLGLIGTVIGFIVALSGVDPQAASDIDAVGPMVSTLIGGMSIALHTTLVGAVLNVWLMANYRLLEAGTVRLITAIVARGERHAHA